MASPAKNFRTSTRPIHIMVAVVYGETVCARSRKQAKKRLGFESLCPGLPACRMTKLVNSPGHASRFCCAVKGVPACKRINRPRTSFCSAVISTTNSLRPSNRSLSSGASSSNFFRSKMADLLANLGKCSWCSLQWIGQGEFVFEISDDGRKPLLSIDNPSGLFNAVGVCIRPRLQMNVEKWNLIITQERINQPLFLGQFPNCASLVFFINAQFMVGISVGQVFQQAGFQFGFHK